MSRSSYWNLGSQSSPLWAGLGLLWPLGQNGCVTEYLLRPGHKGHAVDADLFTGTWPLCEKCDGPEAAPAERDRWAPGLIYPAGPRPPPAPPREPGRWVKLWFKWCNPSYLTCPRPLRCQMLWEMTRYPCFASSEFRRTESVQNQSSVALRH